MTTRLKNITQTVCIVLFLMLFSCASHVREQNENPAPPDAVEPQAEAIVPALDSEAVEAEPAVPETEGVDSEPTAPEIEGVDSEPTAPEIGEVESEPAALEVGEVEPEPVEPEAEAIEPEIAAEETVAMIPPPAAEEGTPYLIQKGDTLWDISNTFLKDPFLWPFIWKANPGINDPDLIYAGNSLMIPSLMPIEQALMAEPAPKEPAEKVVAAVKEPVEQQEKIVEAPVASPTPIEADEEMPVEKRPRFTLPEEQVYPIIDNYAMLSMGFVDMDENEDTITGSPERQKSIFAYDDTVYVSIRDHENTNIGDKFLIYTLLHKVKHPKTRDSFGNLIKGLGILQITAKDPSVDVLTARITLSFDMIEKDNLLTPYQEPSSVYQSSRAKAKDISGYILEVTDKRTINAQTDVVYLDKGDADGVEPGDRFTVYEEAAERGFPRRMLGEVQVLIVKEHTATAIVKKSSFAMERGNAVDFKK